MAKAPVPMGPWVAAAKPLEVLDWAALLAADWGAVVVAAVW